MATEALLQDPYLAALIVTTTCILLAAGLTQGLEGMHTPSFQRLGFSWLMQAIPGYGCMNWNVESLLQQGHDSILKPVGVPFVITWWNRDYVFLPPKYLQDLRRADFYYLSFMKNLSDAMALPGATGGDFQQHTGIMMNTISRGVSPNLSYTVQLMLDEIDYAFDKELKQDGQWHEYTALELCSRLVHRVTTRILSSKELCHNDQFIDISMFFSMSLFMNCRMLARLPLGPLRELGNRLLSGRHKKVLQQNLDILIPAINERFAEKASGKAASRDPDGLQWTMEQSEQYPEWNTPRGVGIHILHNLWAGSAAPGGVVTNLIFQLCMEPRLIPSLREEAEKAIKQHGWSEKALKLPILDSFLRETQRMYSTGTIACARTVVDKPFTFHDGLELPPKSVMAVFTKAIHYDPDNYPYPDTFDGYRFLKLQQSDPGAGESDYAAQTPSSTYLQFGYGKHACPGRFYAVQKMKLILVKLLLEYDFRWAGEVKERPPRTSISGQTAPNMHARICVRRRQE